MNDPLFTHFLKSNGVKIGDLIWGTWINLYTDVLTKTDWLLLFDHLVAYPEYPEIFILLVGQFELAVDVWHALSHRRAWLLLENHAKLIH